MPLVDTSNGIGAILGGGMDLNLWRRLSLRLFEADYVWAHHNFSDEVAPAFPDLRRPDLRVESGCAPVWFSTSASESPPVPAASLLHPAQRSNGG